MQLEKKLHHLKKLMRQRLFIFTLLFFSTTTYGQKYYSTEIISKGDSIMKATVGERIFNSYFRYDTDSYYEYKNFWGKTKWSKLTNHERTKGKFKSMRVRYLFCLNKFNISCLFSRLEFDSSLNQSETIEIDFIPQYVINNTECNFINDTIALQIAKATFTKKGIKTISLDFSYDRHKKIYIWRADNVLTENIESYWKKYGEVQYVEIEALTGKLIGFYPDAIYAPIR